MPADTLDATRLQILRRPTPNGTSQEPDTTSPVTVLSAHLARARSISIRRD